MAEASLLGSSFYRRDSVELAPLLLNKVIRAADGRSARIVEVEAYRGGSDPASHAYRGRSARNGSMFEGPGLLYVYRSYGIHWCANVVAGDGSEAVAVLLRAGQPVAGLEDMRRARWGGRGAHGTDRDLCRGPGRLCQALGIDGTYDGVDLTQRVGPVVLLDDGCEPPPLPDITPRVGISVAVDQPWRFSVPGNRSVSPARPGPRPRRATRSAG